MALTVDDLNAVRAQWEEWTADSGFELLMEIRDDGSHAELIQTASGQIGTRLHPPALYVRVEIWQLRPVTPDEATICAAFRVPQNMVMPREHLIFSERVPYDAQALRASVAVLSRAVAEHVASREAEAEQ